MVPLDNFIIWVRRALRPAVPVRMLEHGDIVEPDDVQRIYSERLAEDGRVVRLYDLRCGRTAAQAFPPGSNPNDRARYPIRVAD